MGYVLSSLVVAVVLISGHSCSGSQAIMQSPINQTVLMGTNSTFFCEADPKVPAFLDILMVLGFKSGETLTIRKGMEPAERGVSVVASSVRYKIGVTILGSQENNETAVTCKVVYYRTDMSPPATLIVKGTASGNAGNKTDNNIAVSFIRSRNSVFEGAERGDVEVCLTVTGRVTGRGDSTITITSDSTGISSGPVFVEVPISHTGVVCHTLTGIVMDNLALDSDGQNGFTLHLQSNNIAVSCEEPCTADYIIIEDDIVYLQFSDPSYLVHEGDDLQQVCIELVAAESIMIQRPVVFRIQANSGTATGGEDFSAGALRPRIGYFNIGARNGDRWCLPVSVTDDSIAEEDEVFSVDLVVSDIQVVLVQRSVDVTIIDNDDILPPVTYTQTD